MRADVTRADLGWRFLQETANVVVLELDRAGTIMRGEPYHK